MRGALIGGVTPALIQALAPKSDALEPAQISAMVHALARDCRWAVRDFHWRPVHCTSHMCIVRRQDDTVAILVGGDAPIVALSASSRVNDEFRYIDDAAFGSFMTGYARGVDVLPASELSRDLSDSDVRWLRSLGSEMTYNLNYWRPVTVGDVIFNTWD